MSALRCAVLTVSDTRTAANDTSGDLLVNLLEADGHRLTLADVVVPPVLPNATGLILDLTAAAAPSLIAGRPDAIIHLAAIVSGEAEAD